MNNTYIDLRHKYFLLNNGEVIFTSKGIDRKYTKPMNNYLTIESYIMTSPKTFTTRWCRIVASGLTLDSIEEREEKFFLDNAENINIYFKNLTGERHSYRPSDMSKHIGELKKINQLRIIKCIRREEREL